MRLQFFSIIMMMIFSLNIQASVTHEQFNKIQSNLLKLYSKSVADLNGQFDIVIKADGAIPQALSRKTSEGVWQIEVYQSMLDLERQSIQTLGMMLCHEVGHFLGGEAYVVGRQLTPAVRSRAPKKMSCEGQADFFSTSVCFRKLADLVPELRNFKEEESDLSNECYLSYKQQDDIDTCLSGLKTAQNLSLVYEDVLVKMGFPTQFQNRFDNTVTDRTLNYVGEYPTLECHYQTLIHGLLCPKNNDDKCIDPRWTRPLCWFNH